MSQEATVAVLALPSPVVERTPSDDRAAILDGIGSSLPLWIICSTYDAITVSTSVPQFRAQSIPIS